MTETEYRGYSRYHKKIEDPAFRERSKTSGQKQSFAREQKRSRLEFREALRRQDLPSVERLKTTADRELRKKARGIRTRQKRMKLIDDHDKAE
jgi:hypothetical protein